MYAYLRCNSNKFLNSISLHIFEKFKQHVKNCNNIQKKKIKKLKNTTPFMYISQI